MPPPSSGLGAVKSWFLIFSTLFIHCLVFTALFLPHFICAFITSLCNTLSLIYFIFEAEDRQHGTNKPVQGCKNLCSLYIFVHGAFTGQTLMSQLNSMSTGINSVFLITYHRLCCNLENVSRELFWEKIKCNIPPKELLWMLKLLRTCLILCLNHTVSLDQPFLSFFYL